MKKLKPFILPHSYKPLCNKPIVEIVDGIDNDTSCTFNSSPDSCSASCSYAGNIRSCVYDSIETLTGCYCLIS